MKKKHYFLDFIKCFILFSILLTTQQMLPQSGIGTTSPDSTLDVREPNPSSPDSSAGIAVPQIASLPTTGNRAGQLVLLTSVNKFFYYNGTSWVCLNCKAFLGDVKQSFDTSDHDGWFLLDGRSLSTLTSSQQDRTTSLGFVNNLPNAEDRVLKSKNSVNSVGGNNLKTIARSNLPNVNFTGTTNTTGSHRHTYTDRGDSTEANNGYGSANPQADDASGSYTTGSSGSHSHTVSVNSGGSGSSLNIENKYLSVNTFIYLGL